MQSQPTQIVEAYPFIVAVSKACFLLFQKRAKIKTDREEVSRSVAQTEY